MNTESPAAQTDPLLLQAVRQHGEGRLAEAEQAYRTVLAMRPDHPVANHNLGALLMQQAGTEVALPHLKAALQADPAQERYWLSYIEALILAGHADAARQTLELGRQRGLSGPAADTLAERLAPPPAAPGREETERVTALFGEGRYAELEAITRDLTLRFPGHGFGWKALGIALRLLGRNEEAAQALRKAAPLLPEDPVAQHNLGLVLMALARFPEAEVSFRKTVALKPDQADAHFQLGDALRHQHRTQDAEAEFRRTTELQPNHVGAHLNLGSTRYELGRLRDAETSYRRAMELAPNWAEVHGSLGYTLRDQGRLQEAEACFRRAYELQPQDLQHAFHAHFIFPAIPPSNEAIASWRARFSAGLAGLADLPGFLENPGEKMHFTMFFLAYQSRNDRPEMEALCRLFRARVKDINAVAPHVSGWRPPAQRGGRIRIGFLSEYLELGHTIGKLNQGFIRHLDRSRFEVVAIHAAPPKGEDLHQAIDELADRSLVLPDGLVAQQNAVAAEQLDVLFYPDIGMSPTTYFLAHARLAPVQAVSWGHPDTSGLDTMDYFVSADPIEPEDAEEHYTERLIRLSRLPCAYQPLHAPNRVPDRVALGLPETGTLYACPQSLFKIHPDFDAVLAEIAAGDPDGHIVLLESHVPAWTDLLRARWAGTFPILLERVLFLPRLQLDRFMAMMARIDVVLDPLHFGSGNTLYEGLVYGMPAVTWPGRFMRGRIVAGAYRQLGVADAPVAARIEDYAPLALALGRDAERRNTLRRASIAAAGKLFGDTGLVREFEAFLEAAVAAAGRGEKLPPGWRPQNH